jgi:hypothetical protein
MNLTAPVTITGNIAGAYAMKFKVQGIDGDVDLLTLLQYLADTAEGGGGGGAGGDTIYIDTDWVIKGSEGINVTTSNAGVYEIDIPAGKSISSAQTRIINEVTELNGDGNMVINIDYATSGFNLGFITALTPLVVFLDELGNQFLPSELGITVTNTAASGISSTVIGILGSLEVPFSVKLIF